MTKNLGHAGGALLVALLLTALYGLTVRPVGLGAALFGILALLGQLPLLLGVGNVLSVLAPRKFHASLRRRDRPPAVPTVAGLAAAAAGLAPAVLALQRLGHTAPGPLSLGGAGCAGHGPLGRIPSPPPADRRAARGAARGGAAADCL